MKRAPGNFSRKRPNGFALIITLIMLVLAAVIAVTVLTNATQDRITADAFGKRARAEMAAQSGLAAALNALVGASGPNDFRYVTSVGDTGQPELTPLIYTAASGVMTLDNSHQRNLFSTGSTTATLTLSSSANPKPTRTPGYVPINIPVNGVSQEVERYAFYVDEGGSRQNLSVQGGANRTYSRDPNEVPLVSATAAPVPFTSTQMTSLTTDRSLIFTPMTANPVLSANPVSPVIDDYSYASASAIANLNPEGNPRVNLTKLKAYIDGLSVDQTKGNPKSKLVDQLLDSGEKGDNWGGGNLSILTKLPRYSGNQPKQIVANLIDYLDSDLIPTTDDIDHPTYFGVEGQDSGGQTVGHPYVNFVGTGLIFNRSSASGNVGGLNSTRILLVLGLVNPWTTKTKDWDVSYVEPEVEIVINGTVSGGTLGTSASAYFQKTFSSANADPSGNPEKGFPVKNIPPNAGYAFPAPMSGTKSYATYMELKGTGSNGLGQPPGMTFSGLSFKINKLRIKFTSSDGPTGYVQVLDHLTDAQPQPAAPNFVDCDHSGTPSSLIYKFSGGAPGATDKADYHLNSDPRVNFLTPAASPSSSPQNWLLAKSTEANPAPPNPQTTVAIFGGADTSNYDFTAASPSVSSHLWYTKTDITSNFYVKSPPASGSSSPSSDPTQNVNSSGELGYLHTGIPWETLRFYVTGNEQNGKERDKELLAYVQSGTFNGADYGAVPTHAGQTAPGNPIPLLGGPLNVNTNKRPTLQALFLGTTEVNDSSATSKAQNGGDSNAVSIADGLALNAAGTPLALPGDFLRVPAVKTITDGKTTDFDREIIARRAANVLGTQSTRFTVYTLGEARDKIGANLVTTSKVNLRAEVEMQTDQNGRPTPKVLSSVYYTN